VIRKDFVFFNDHDAFWMQSARRPENPGYIPNQTSAFRYHAFPLSEFISLVPHFVLAPTSSGGVIDNRLSYDIPGSNSLSARAKPYAPGDGPVWGDDNFNYSTNIYNRRALVVTSNSVSTATSPRYMPNIAPNPPPPDLNEDGDNTNDVASRDMLAYAVSLNGTRTSIGAPKYHLEQYDLSQPASTWSTSNSAHFPGDYIQVAAPGGIVHNFVYARTLQKATSSPLNASTTDPARITGNGFPICPPAPP